MEKKIQCACSYEYLEILTQCPSCGRPTSANRKATASKKATSNTSTSKGYNIPIPPKPQLFSKGNMTVFFIGLGLLILSCLLLTVAPDRPEFSDEPIDFLFWAAFGVVGALMFIGVPVVYLLELRDYLQATNDYEGYVQRRTMEIQRNKERADANYTKTIEMQKAQAKAEEERLQKLPVCPICGKKDCVKRISTLNRSASVAAFGLASAKIAKQYQCERCKHLW